MNKKSGFFLVVAFAGLVMALQYASESPWIVVLLGAMIGFAIWLRIAKKKAGQLSLNKRLDQLAAMLDSIGAGEHLASDSQLKLRPNEIELFTSNVVGLTEYRSTGASYRGGSQGVSVRIAKGVSYRVGANKGSLTKNPEQLTRLDVGQATYTNQRIVFSGPNVSRQWEFDKLIGVTMGANGESVAISVENRQKTSGLEAVDENELPPGFMAALAIEYSEKGESGIRSASVQYARQIREVVRSN